MNTGLYMLLAGLCCAATACLSSEGSGNPNGTDDGGNPVVLVKTNKGEIRVRLFKDKAPVTVDNFLAYVKDGFYNGTVFHRVIEDFMIQGGGFDKDLEHKDTKPAIKNEAANGLGNTRGTLAMARTADINSASSQFFINVVDNPFLNHRDESRAGFGYCVFGEVIDGMTIVDTIRRVPTRTQDIHQNVPVEPIVIQAVTLETAV